jgi:hypothetical protein
VQSILLAHDEATSVDRAFEFAVQLARAFSARPYVASVVDLKNGNDVKEADDRTAELHRRFARLRSVRVWPSIVTHGLANSLTSSSSRRRNLASIASSFRALHRPVGAMTRHGRRLMCFFNESALSVTVIR